MTTFLRRLMFAAFGAAALLIGFVLTTVLVTAGAVGLTGLLAWRWVGGTRRLGPRPRVWSFASRSSTRASGRGGETSGEVVDVVARDVTPAERMLARE
ncbi:hypothetical protein [Caldimonas brevitalea]|uniref:Uncharacterized protein n=1 Tax=Caldimonas brevitalea TaxID=413882 RepID=A0A0G3BUU8_9BURK|nr:hypothetical protein [Caldimonas brevitalea]AKJ30275.1 hypothetical protein AAW51_3584 [Caldimonas brevitalea]